MSQLFADRFKSARMLKGLSLQDLADKLENRVSRQALHRYEKGEVIPDSNMLELLCRVLDVRSDYFFREIKIVFSDIEFRKLSGLPSKEENRIIGEVRDKLERYLELEEILLIKNDFVNPLQDFGKINDFPQVQQAAEKLRAAWKLGYDPIFNTIELLEDHFIKVIEVNAGESFDGMQTWVNQNIPVIAINKDKVKSADRIRFTVLHELCHLLLDMKHLSERQKEKLCHQFAAAMLLPKVTGIMELGQKRSKLMIQELGAVKKSYGISIQAIVMRAKDLNIISESYCKQFFFFMKQMGWKVTEPIEYTGSESSGRFEQLLFRALAEELISVSKAASLVNETVAEFRKKLLQVA